MDRDRRRRQHGAGKSHPGTLVSLSADGKNRSPMLFTGVVAAGLLLLLVRGGPGSRHSDESPSHGDEDHWTDARAANSVVLRWLHDSPGTPTITVPREEVAWLKELTASAARQADVHQPKRPGPEDRTPPPIDR